MVQTRKTVTNPDRDGARDEHRPEDQSDGAGPLSPRNLDTLHRLEARIRELERAAADNKGKRSAVPRDVPVATNRNRDADAPPTRRSSLADARPRIEDYTAWDAALPNRGTPATQHAQEARKVRYPLPEKWAGAYGNQVEAWLCAIETFLGVHAVEEDDWADRVPLFLLETHCGGMPGEAWENEQRASTGRRLRRMPWGAARQLFLTRYRNAAQPDRAKHMLHSIRQEPAEPMDHYTGRFLRLAQDTHEVPGSHLRLLYLRGLHGDLGTFVSTMAPPNLTALIAAAQDMEIRLAERRGRERATAPAAQDRRGEQQRPALAWDARPPRALTNQYSTGPACWLRTRSHDVPPARARKQTSGT